MSFPPVVEIDNLPLPVTDNGGSLTVDGTVTANQGTANTATNRWPVQLTDGTSLVAVSAVDAPAAGVVGLVVRNIPERKATFTAIAQGITPGANKSMLAVFVPSGNAAVLRLQRVYLRNVQTAGVNGVMTTFELRRLSALSGGTAVTPGVMDTADTLTSGVLCVTGGTFTAGNIVDRWRLSGEEVDITANPTVTSADRPFQNVNLWNVGLPPEGALTVRAAQGFHIQCSTNTTVGSFDVVFVFTQG